MKNVVVIGGGTGSSVILRGFKLLDDIKLTAVVTVADDGGSTGRLRKQYQIPAMGDIRNVMVAMAESESLLGPLMDYRFEGAFDIGGHNLGNLMLTALTQTTGNFMEAIQKLSKVLNVKGSIIPSTTQVVTLIAKMEDGTIVRGESNIPKFQNRIDTVFYQERVTASKEAIKAIQSADYIVYGVGSLYTSIIPNLIIPEIREAILSSKAKKIYFCNAMSQPGETDGYTLEDHVQAILKHSNEKAIDIVVASDDIISDAILKRYEQKGSYPVKIIDENHHFSLYKKELLKFDDGFIRHDSIKLKQAFEDIINEE
ncbi:MAG: uridine diphosphate-N-acetylglucosamine-binding protein YvcK [Erysipelotrichia bacterium]|nr:uridine diphosphate-N-acetylglucosamine-binding protein YvcK [Erysipelotrichia bacterium]NCC54801.1 uridine diphosphate-N-acetylglucosamine-binding protein YvcK [Erysipelotrichia bacterium]